MQRGTGQDKPDSNLGLGDWSVITYGANECND